jgi:hypothetical protein
MAINSDPRTAAVLSALSDWPAEICRLTASYAVPTCKHQFFLDSFGKSDLDVRL